jgi:hypothetical protein
MWIRHLDPHDPPPRWALGPPGEPPLAYAVVRGYERWRVALVPTFGCAVALVYLSAVVSWADPDRWRRWLPFFVLALLLFWAWRAWAGELPGWVVAGSRWVAAGTGHPRRGRWCVVRVYEFDRVLLEPAQTARGITVRGRLTLTLSDPSTPRSLAVDYALVTANPGLWALVHNGVLHAEARGAAIDNDTRESLRLHPA